MTQDNSTARFSILRRLTTHLGLKAGLAVVLNLWALLPFFALQHHSLFPARSVPSTLIDRMVPFDDRAVWLYLSLFLLMPIGPLLMIDRKDLLRYASGVVFMSAAANLVFLFFPTAFPRPASAADDTLYLWLVSFVTPQNDFPSLHAAMTVFSALCSEIVLRRLDNRGFWHSGVWLWSLAILYATLATKEHLAVDIAAGIVLGLASFRLSFGKVNSRQMERALLQTVAESAELSQILNQRDYKLKKERSRS